MSQPFAARICKASLVFLAIAVLFFGYHAWQLYTKLYGELAKYGAGDPQITSDAFYTHLPSMGGSALIIVLLSLGLLIAGLAGRRANKKQSQNTFAKLFTSSIAIGGLISILALFVIGSGLYIAATDEGCTPEKRAQEICV